MAQDMPRPSIGTPPVRLVAGGLIAAACGLWLATTTISRVSPPAEEPRAAAGALVARGRTLLEAQRLAAAYDCFAEAVRLDPAAADGHRGLAAVAYDQGSLMQAVTHLEHAAALDPDDGRPWRMIGHICRDLDHHERAVSSYREALGRELAPAARSEVRAELAGREADADAWNASIRDELAATCEELGRHDLAAMWRHAAAQARSRVSATPRDAP
jgi:Tfp pilus assembly protein PilF